MPIDPITYSSRERIFVDREPCIQIFRENIQNSENREYNVLFYHGIAGIGKSKLQKELQKILNEEYPEIISVAIDLNTKTYRDVGTFLIVLRNKIQENLQAKRKAKFYFFNTAHAIYWKKLHPESPLQKENYPLIEEGGFFSRIINILDEFGPARLTWDIINNAPDNIQKFLKEQAIDIHKLAVMEAHEIEKLLPGFFAADFTSYLGTDSKAYIFIDTYEAIWEDVRNKGSFHEKDEWIRDNLIPNMKGVSWVICGREKLLWAYECDLEWKMYLEQHSVDELPESYCTEFLEDCGIENKDIRDTIIKASEGVPYYLNLSVDTFEKISKKRQPISEDFGKTQLEIFNTFVKYLERNEIQALKVLSVPNLWDRELFEILMKKFDPGLPISSFSELMKFSFIKINSEGRFSIHQLMRTNLQAYQDPINKENVHKFMFEYYNNKLKEIDIKSITSEHENALKEAFYHAKESMKAKDLLDWYIVTSEYFNKAELWQLIIPICEEMLQFLEAELGPEHPDVATTLNGLALLYSNIGACEKAISLCQRARQIREKSLGLQHLDVAIILDNLSFFYRRVGNYADAISLCERALYIRTKILGPQHPDVATNLNCLAILYDKIWYYKTAFPLYQRALEIFEKTKGPQHLDVAKTLNNLAMFYDHVGDYEKAIQLCERALEIFETVRGSQHLDVATAYENLAGLYYRRADYEKAISLCQRALDIRQAVLGPKHPSIASNFTYLAMFYEGMENYEKALSLCERALEIFETTFGSQHPDVATTLNNIAGLYYRRADYEKAIPLCERALEIFEKTKGPRHPDVAMTLKTLEKLYCDVGDYKKAIQIIDRITGKYNH